MPSGLLGRCCGGHSLDGVVKEVAQDAAQIQLRHGQLHRNVGVHVDRDIPGLGQGNFAVENGVSLELFCTPSFPPADRITRAI